MVECCFTSTETVGLLGTGAQEGHLDFHTVSEHAQVIGLTSNTEKQTTNSAFTSSASMAMPFHRNAGVVGLSPTFLPPGFVRGGTGTGTECCLPFAPYPQHCDRDQMGLGEGVGGGGEGKDGSVAT